MLAHVIHYLSIAIAVVLAACGTGIGQGIASGYALDSMSRQPMGREDVFRAMMIGLALVESGGIFGLVVSLILFASKSITITLGSSLAFLGAGIAIGVSGAIVGIASSMAVSAACVALSRQPFQKQKTFTLMLLSQSIIEAPVIFAFIVALLIKGAMHEGMSVFDGVRLLCAGLVAGFGCVGPAIGQALFSARSCGAVGIDEESYKAIVPYSLLCQAVIETPVIFSLLLSFIFIYMPFDPASGILGMVTFVSATISLCFGAFGTGIATGFVASKGSEQIAHNSQSYPLIVKASLLSQAIIEASVIYSFIIALLLVWSV